MYDVVVSSRGRSFFEKVVTPLVKGFARLGVSPNMLTFVGLLFTVAAVPFYGLAKAEPVYFLAAALFLALGSFFDGLDGPLARYTGKQSSFGAFLDSFIDRISDSLIVLGFLWTGLVDGFLAVVMLASMMLVSYARARAESLNVSLKDIGLGERAVRLVIAFFGTLLAYVTPVAIYAAALIITMVSLVTVVQRVLATASALVGK